MHPDHPNAMRFTAFDSRQAIVAQEVYFSVGGGFIEREGVIVESVNGNWPCPFPVSSADELLATAQRAALPIWAYGSKTRKRCRRAEVRRGILVGNLAQVMRDSYRARSCRRKASCREG